MQGFRGVTAGTLHGRKVSKNWRLRRCGRQGMGAPTQCVTRQMGKRHTAFARTQELMMPTNARSRCISRCCWSELKRGRSRAGGQERLGRARQVRFQNRCLRSNRSPLLRGEGRLGQGSRALVLGGCMRRGGMLGATQLSIGHDDWALVREPA